MPNQKYRDHTADEEIGIIRGLLSHVVFQPEDSELEYLWAKVSALFKGVDTFLVWRDGIDGRKRALGPSDLLHPILNHNSLWHSATESVALEKLSMDFQDVVSKRLSHQQMCECVVNRLADTGMVAAVILVRNKTTSRKLRLLSSAVRREISTALQIAMARDYRKFESLEMSIPAASTEHLERVPRDVTQPSYRGISKDALTSALEAALEREEFYLVYQPRIHIYDDSIDSVEVLLRWKHPVWGLIPPSEFIPLAEAEGFMIPIGEWVIQEVCRQLMEWKSIFSTLPRIAVNVSAEQLEDRQLVGVLTRWMEHYDISPKHLEMEITEAALVERREAMIQTVAAIRELGIQVSIDDFGTGYSSLEILRHVRVDYVKVDRSFVCVLNRRNKAIVSTLIQLARNLELKTIAEGVETAEQRDFLIAQGCDEVQGYFYSSPLLPADFVDFCHRQKSDTP